MKIVRSDVAHVWTNQSQDRSMNPGRTLSHHGAFLRSYELIIARVVQAPDGRAWHFVSTTPYSTTTARHQREAANAAPYPERLVRFDGSALYETTPADEFAAHVVKCLLREARALHDKAIRARANAGFYARSYRHRVETAWRVREAFAPLLPPGDLGLPGGAAAEEFQSEMEQRAGGYGRRATARSNALPRNNPQFQAELGEWRAWQRQNLRPTNEGLQFVRFKDGRAQTSMGVCAGRGMAKAVLAKWDELAAISRKSGMVAYTQERVCGWIGAAAYHGGECKIGCHHFDAEEVERIRAFAQGEDAKAATQGEDQ